MRVYKKVIRCMILFIQYSFTLPESLIPSDKNEHYYKVNKKQVGSTLNNFNVYEIIKINLKKLIAHIYI